MIEHIWEKAEREGRALTQEEWDARAEWEFGLQEDEEINDINAQIEKEERNDRKTKNRME